MLKVDISGEKNNRQILPDLNDLGAELRGKKESGHKKSPSEKQTLEAHAPNLYPHPEEEITKTGIRKKRYPLLFGLLVILVLALVYFQGDYFKRLLFPQKTKTAEVSREAGQKGTAISRAPENQTQAALKDSSIKEGKPSLLAGAGNDPVLSTLYLIGKATPFHIWLTETEVQAKGVYAVKGISFFHAAMDSFVTELESRGSVTVKDLPAASKFPDAKYTFKFSGKMNGIKISENLHAIPLDMLISLGDSLKGIAEREGAIVVKLPKTGQTIQEDDLSFIVEGSYSGLQKILGELTLTGKNRIYRLVIRPAGTGKTFNRIRASFSLWTDSSL